MKSTNLEIVEEAGKMDSCHVPPRLTVSIIGSYNKHLSHMKKLMVECKKHDLEVLIPKYAVRKFSRYRFVFLKGENGTPKELQEKNFRFIEHSSFVLVANPEGYIGSSTAMEIGYAIAKGIPVFCIEKPKDYIFRLYTEYGKDLSEIKKLLLPRSKEEILVPKTARVGSLERSP